MKKNVEVSLDYLALDKCKDEKQRVIKLSEDRENRKAEMAQVKKILEITRQGVFEGMKEELRKEFPDLVFSQKNPIGSPICAKYKTDDYIFYVSIAKNLECVLFLDIECSWMGIMFSEAIIKQFKDILSWYTPWYKMYQTFGPNEFDKAYSCNVNVIKKIKEVWLNAINIE